MALDNQVDEYAVPIMKIRPSNVAQYISNYYSLYHTGLRKVLTVAVGDGVAQTISKSKVVDTFALKKSKSVINVSITTEYISPDKTVPVSALAAPSEALAYSLVSAVEKEAGDKTVPSSVGKSVGLSIV